MAHLKYTWRVQLAAKTKQNGPLQNGIRGVHLATGIRPQRKREEGGLPPNPKQQASWDGDHMQILLFFMAPLSAGTLVTPEKLTPFSI